MIVDTVNKQTNNDDDMEDECYFLLCGKFSNYIVKYIMEYYWGKRLKRNCCQNVIVNILSCTSQNASNPASNNYCRLPLPCISELLDEGFVA